MCLNLLIMLTNRGFMRGPFLPLYGSGAIMMLVVSIPFQGSIALTYVAGCVGATVLEYVTGVTMEALFKVRYWDYSNQKFNFQGHVCLGTSLSWGFLTILMTEVVHVPIEKFVLSIPSQVLTVLLNRSCKILEHINGIAKNSIFWNTEPLHISISYFLFKTLTFAFIRFH